MATALHPGSVPNQGIRTTVFDQPTFQAYAILYAGYIVLPIVAGLDKFFHLLVNWDAYLAPIVPKTLGISAHSFMLVVGVIEILAGIIVAVRPHVGAYIVGLWLLGIIVNLLMLGGASDIALRDFGLSLGAFALARLSGAFGARPLGV
jgi:hypothetical protein